MSETLVRIPLSGQSGFHPLALAPGLPMLDSKKLTYQVLLGWFGDVLADPQLTEDGVTFHVQKSGQRIRFVDRQLATARDLEGSLAPDFERIKKALFGVRPVSPSERLIFNRLQPPIGNHLGYLYRVRVEDGADRLVWCWGFQRRSTDGVARVCPNSDCSLLLIEQAESIAVCPRCKCSLNIDVAKRGRSRPPVGAFAAALLLTGLAGGTYWYAAHTSDDLPPGLPEINISAIGAQLEQLKLPNLGSPSTSESIDPTQSIADANNTEPLPLPLPLPDQVASGAPSDATSITSDANSNDPIGPAIGTGANGDVVGIAPSVSPTIRLPEPNRATDNPTNQPAIANNTPFGPIRSNAAAPGTPDEAGPFPDSPRQNVGRLAWHQDYLAGYKEALEQRKLFLMVFRDFDENDSIESFTNGFASPELESKLENFTRVVLPLSTMSPATGNETPEPLLAHRSFRQLGMRAGLVIVDLREPGSALYGRVISALRQPASGKYSTEVFSQLLDLPGGNIQQRSLLLAIRTSSPQSNFSSSELSASLNELANRNARYMVQFGQPGTFDVEHRTARIAQEFGESASVSLLVWTSGENLELHDATLKAVESWTNNPGDHLQLTQAATAYGIDMIQEPETGRWFATCVIVRTN